MWPCLPLLSFPQVLAGIQCCSLLSLYSCGCLGKSHGFPIKNVGNDRGGLKTSGMTEGALGMTEGALGMTEGIDNVGKTEAGACGRAYLFCHSRRC